VSTSVWVLLLAHDRPPGKTMEAALEGLRALALSSSARQTRDTDRKPSAMILLDTNICIYIINARPASVLAPLQAVTGWARIGLVQCGWPPKLAFWLWPRVVSAQPPGPGDVSKAPLPQLRPLMSAAAWAYGDLRCRTGTAGARQSALSTR